MEVWVADINAGSKTQGNGGGTYRAALAAVIILSVLLAAAIIALAVGFMHQYRLYQQDQAPAATTSAVSAAAVQLAPGAHIVSASTDAGKLVLHVQTPAGAQVDVFDLATGRLTSQVKDGH
jgi:hypothetical protein